MITLRGCDGRGSFKTVLISFKIRALRLYKYIEKYPNIKSEICDFLSLVDNNLYLTKHILKL